MSQAVI